MAQQISYEHNNRLTTPLETAVWWVEHTIATRGFKLGQANTANMSWFTYHSFDSITISLLVLLLIVYALKCIVMQFVKCCCTYITRKTSDAIKKHNWLNKVCTIIDLTVSLVNFTDFFFAFLLLQFQRKLLQPINHFWLKTINLKCIECFTITDPRFISKCPENSGRFSNFRGKKFEIDFYFCVASDTRHIKVC